MVARTCRKQLPMANKSQPDAPSPRRYEPADPRASAVATDIDRRTCRRKVPMKLLCLGISRTGTYSLRHALFDLGYDDVYHYSAMLQENPRDSVMWVEAMEAKFEGKGKPFEKKDWDQLLGHCEAITDNPSIMFYQELLEAYPDAQVILTVRDNAEDWWRSIRNTLIPFLDDVFPRTLAGKVIRWIFGFFEPQPSIPQKAMNRVFEIQDQHTPYFTPDKDKAIAYYHWYNAEIKRLVPKNNLLVFNVKEGWGPLCKFLDKKMPTWEFPRGNDSIAFNGNVAKMQKLILSQILSNMVKTLGGATLIGAVAWAWSRTRH